MDRVVQVSTVSRICVVFTFRLDEAPTVITQGALFFTPTAAQYISSSFALS